MYNKRPLILKKGDLGDAVRASMSFPAMFKPIEIDSILAYDGGIYNISGLLLYTSEAIQRKGIYRLSKLALLAAVA